MVTRLLVVTLMASLGSGACLGSACDPHDVPQQDGATPAEDGGLTPDALTLDAQEWNPDAAPCAFGCEWPSPCSTILDATRLGAEARFVGVTDHQSVLAERRVPQTGLIEPLVLVADLRLPPPEDIDGPALSEITLVTESATSLWPLGGFHSGGLIDGQGGVQCDTPLFGDHCLVTLLCSPSHCALYGVPEGSLAPGSLAPIPGGGVPAGPEVRGIARDLWQAWDLGPAACVFGDGIRCFDGSSWFEVLAPGTGPAINDLSARGLPIAVGDAGRLLFAEEAGGWREPEPLTPLDLFAVDSDPSVAAAGEDGTLILGSREAQHVYRVAEEDLVALRLSQAWNGRLTGLLRSGGVVRLVTDTYETTLVSSCIEPSPLAGSGVGIGFRFWGFCSHWMLVTDSHVVTLSDGCAE